MKRSKTVTMLATAASLAAAVFVSVFAMPVRPAQAALTNVVLVNPAFSLAFSASYLAEDLGMFTKHGLHVKLIEIPGVGAINAVISGSAEFAESSALSQTRAAARGQRLLAIVETLDRPIVQVALRKSIAEAGGFNPKESFAKRGALLRGRTIAVDGAASLIHAYVLLMAKRGGVPADQVHVAFMAPPSMIAAFKAKQIDGYAMSPPWPLVTVLQGSAVMLASGPAGEPADLLPFANTVVLTRPETCREHRSVCMAMGQSFAEAEAYIHDHPAKALALLKKRFSKLSPKVLEAAFDTIRGMSPTPPVVSEKGLENADNFNIAAGLMKPQDRLKSYSDLYTNEFVK